jgi:cytochrome c nitrite reductase small subunit
MSGRAARRRAVAGVVAVLLGVLVGMGGYAVRYSHATDYLGKDPRTCANCHAMDDHYRAWAAGPHARAATCADCHLPHDDVVHQYLVKAEDGLLHGAKFTLGDYPENIVIRDRSLTVANEACLFCHADLTTDTMFARGEGAEEISCVRCHAGTGHE